MTPFLVSAFGSFGIVLGISGILFFLKNTKLTSFLWAIGMVSCVVIAMTGIVFASVFGWDIAGVAIIAAISGFVAFGFLLNKNLKWSLSRLGVFLFAFAIFIWSLNR